MPVVVMPPLRAGKAAAVVVVELLEVLDVDVEVAVWLDVVVLDRVFVRVNVFVAVVILVVIVWDVVLELVQVVVV